MSRKVLDLLASWIGVGVVVVLLVAGGLLLWGHSYVNNQVRSQLAMQQIYFPPAAAFTHPNPPETTVAMRSTVGQYAGQQLLSGPQAEVYANDFIAHHLYAMPMHGVYAKLATASMADPKNASLAALEQVSFRGTTLRAMLLEAYGFWKIGQVMLWGAIASFILAACMLILVILGFRHASRTARERRLFEGAMSAPSTPVEVA
jgi:hypothetical protein